MYLTTPTTVELQTLEVPALLDMLSKQTSIYIKLLHEEGISDNSMACKEILVNIQAALKININLEKKTVIKESESKNV